MAQPCPFKVGDHILIKAWTLGSTSSVTSVAVKVTRVVLPDLLLVEYVRVKGDVVQVGQGRIQMSDIKEYNSITLEQYQCFQNMEEHHE